MNFSDKQSAIINSIRDSLHKKDISALKVSLLKYSEFAKEMSETSKKAAKYQEAVEKASKKVIARKILEYIYE